MTPATPEGTTLHDPLNIFSSYLTESFHSTMLHQ